MKSMELIGNIGKIEMKYTPTGKAVTEFSLAVNEKKNGEKVTEWYKVVAWEKVAEIIKQYADAGSKIFVKGVPSVEVWTDKNSGEARARIVLTVRDFEFLGKRENVHNSEPQAVAQIDNYDDAPF